MLVLALPFGCDQAPSHAPKPETARAAPAGEPAGWQGAAPARLATLPGGLTPGRSFRA